MRHNNVIDCLKERGFFESLSSENLREICDKPIKIYAGFDPTADSLHLGNLMGIIALAWFQRFGHTPVVILGGATGRIGDPSGKSIERPLLSDETILHNVQRIRQHFEQVLDFETSSTMPLIFNNDQWFSQLNVIDFLRDVGKHFRLGPMLGKESVKTRLHSEEGISFTEFSYQVLQAYDFYHLYSKHDVILQMGGSDQWGNLTAGIDLIRKLNGKPAYALTWPLLTRSDGKKFGKSEEGAVWLAADRLSPYQFYQYFMGIPDADVINLMKMLTFMEMEEILEFEKAMQKKDYLPNTAQKRLAKEVTYIIHGNEGVKKALKVTEGAAPGSFAKLNAEILKEIAPDMPSTTLPMNEVIGKNYAEIAVKSGILSSKGEANRLIKNNGAYLNNQRISDPNFHIEKKNLIDGQYLLISAGKKKKILIEILSI